MKQCSAHDEVKLNSPYAVNREVDEKVSEGAEALMIIGEGL
jgi:hypothetical protein